MVRRVSLQQWGRVLLPLILLTISSLQCGIPSNPYLFPPKFSKEAVGGETTFEFYNDTRTNFLFLEGYEIYYKFYSDAPEDTSYTSDKTQIESLGDGQESQTLTTLENLNFHRLYQIQPDPGSSTKPLLSIEAGDKNTEFLVTIDFSYLDSVTKPYPLVTFASSSIEIGRYVKVDSSLEYSLESFLPDNFQKTYSDLDAALSSETFINIALVAFTYGVDDSLSELLSLPLHLGKIRLSSLL